MGVDYTEAELKGRDDKGYKGKWLRLIKWSKKKQDDGTYKYLEYPPNIEFKVPTAVDQKDETNSKIKCGIFDQDGTRFPDVISADREQVVPKRSDVAVLAKWSRLTAGGYGVSFKPEAHQIRVYPRDTIPQDECLLGDDDDDGGEENNDELSNDLSGGWAGVETGPPQPMNVPEPMVEPESTDVAESDSGDGDDGNI